MTKDDIKNWLNNFQGQVFDKKYERKLALFLLSHFVFYNEVEVRHLCRTLYENFLHKILENRPKEDIIGVLKKVKRDIQCLPLGSTGESGSFISYYFRQMNDLSKKNFISIPNQNIIRCKILVFLDDVTITGSQAAIYTKRILENCDCNCDEMFLLTFFSTPKAIELLENTGITVLSCVNLDERCKCFSEESSIFIDMCGHQNNCERFAKVYGMELEPGIELGYDDGQYLFGFFYNTPDNTLPIFWSDKNGWHPLFKRYKKKYNFTPEINNESATFI